MSLSSISVRRPVLAIVLNLIILLFGYMGFKSLGIRELPVIESPMVQIRTSYAGASADIVEAQITYPLEKALNGIEGVKSISSSSSGGSSSISVEFNLNVNLETATNDVRDKVSQAIRSLPQDIDAPPVVSKDVGGEYIIVMTVSNDKMTDLEVNDYVENNILPRLQTISGVGSVNIFGEKKYAMRLWLDPVKMSAYGITVQEIRLALDKENIELPTGRMEGNRTELTVKANAKFTDENGFNNMIIRADNSGRVIRLQDVGYAKLGAENEETFFRINNVPSLGCAIVPQPGANHVEIADEFYKRFEQLKKELPTDFKLNVSTDTTRFIKRSITEVTETLIIALLLVVIIIYLFFRDWTVALRPLIDIPVSLIATFFIMYILGFSINVLTMLAIVLATGLVVDDGIVVTENIFKKIEKGLSPLQAAIEGSNEIAFAVVSTSITLTAIFLPIIFMEGFVGKLFKEFGIVVASAVLISIFVSLTLTPMLSAFLITDTSKKTKFYVFTEPFFVWMNESYSRSLQGFMKYRWISFIILGVAVGLTVFLWKLIPAELTPVEDRSMLRITMTLPEGASFEYTDEFMLKYIKLIRDSIPENKLVMSISAASPGGSSSGVNSGFSRIPLVDPDERERSQQQIADKLTQLLKRFPEAKVQVTQEQTINTGARGLPVQYVIQAPNFEKLREALPKFMEEAQKDPTFSIVDVNLKFNRPELNILIDREKAHNLGVNVSDIAQTLQLALSGQRFGYFYMRGRQYQVIGQLERSNRNETIDLKNINIRTGTGALIPLDNLVKFEEGSSPAQLFRFNRYQSATVSAGLSPGKTVGDGVKAMNEIRDRVLDDSFSTALLGAARDFVESSSNTSSIFILALVLVYLILAAQFESFIDPFTIMLTVPLAVAGGVFSLWYFNQTNNIFSQIGMIMLIGLVTKNGILIVEFANHLKSEGRSVREAAIEAANGRLRPILMTSIATTLGALPIALAFGAAAKSRMGMGIVIVGGLLISLVFTLYVIPAVYTYLSKKKVEKHD